MSEEKKRVPNPESRVPLWRAYVLTLFPEMFPGALGISLMGRALEKKLWELHTINIRDFAFDKHKTVDDTPYGGGSGMVMKPDVVDTALKSLPPGSRKIYLTPRGKRLTQDMLKSFAATQAVAFLCGRYEGIDARVIEAHQMEEISLGDFVLSGGEVAAAAIIEGVVRLIPGVLGNETATTEESFNDGLLEYPQFTKPALWEGRPVPEILLSGDHGKVKAWRRAEAEKLTKERRPDLIEARGKRQEERGK